MEGEDGDQRGTQDKRCQEGGGEGGEKEGLGHDVPLMHGGLDPSQDEGPVGGEVGGGGPAMAQSVLHHWEDEEPKGKAAAARESAAVPKLSFII